MTKEELEKMILCDQLSYEEIGRKTGITGNAVKGRAKRMGIRLPSRRVVNPNENFSHLRFKELLVCPICGKEFRKTHKTSVTCSVECSKQYYALQRKNKKEENLKHNIWDGKERPNMWKPQSYIKSNGYIWAKCPSHPNAFKDGYVLAHRIVVENHIGRLLRPNEVVHHKDGNKTNNDISNLEILSSAEHTKLHYIQRVGENNLGLSVVDIICPVCGNVFTRQLRYATRKTKRQPNCCSKKCASILQGQKVPFDKKEYDDELRSRAYRI